MRFFISILVVLVAQSQASASTAEELAATRPDAVLEAAFERLYGCDVRYDLNLAMYDSRGRSREMRLEAAAKQVSGGRRVLAYITAPSYIRGMRILILESDGGRSDAWVYRPSDERNRRISTAQRDDRFLGSDFTYDDFERRRVESYRVGEAVAKGDLISVSATPVDRRLYDRLSFDIDAETLAILEIRMFKARQEAPSRVLTAPKSKMLEIEGCLVPTEMKMNDSSGSWSELRFSSVVVSPDLDDRLFEPGALERSYKGIPNGHLE